MKTITKNHSNFATMHIHSIYIYPIKGCRGISVQSALLQPEGFEYDRRWMLVDEEGEMISQRSHPLLTQFVPEITSDRLIINYQKTSTSVGLEECINQATGKVRVFDDTMLAHYVSSAADEWFSDIMEEKVRLVKVGAQTIRKKDFTHRIQHDLHPTNTTTVGFADGYPYLVLGTASMDNLNNKIDTPLSIDRFRANIIIKTEEAHIEDTWKKLLISNQELILTHPCARCQVPNIDQLTGISTKEPNRTLATYRRMDNKIYFGMNAVAMTDGKVSVGNEVAVN